MNIKKLFDPHVSCRPGRVTANQHIFKSGLVKTFPLYNKVESINRCTEQRIVQYIIANLF